MKTRDCERIEAELSAYLDGELDPVLRRSVAAHLDACAGCAAAVDRLRAVGTVLRRWDAEETRYATTNAFRSRVMQRVGAPIDRRLQLVADPPTRRPVLVLARATAAAVLIVAAGAAVSLAWPRVGTGTSDDLMAAIEARILERLAEERNELARSADIPADNSMVPHGDAASGSPSTHVASSAFDLSRVGPWETAVTPREDTARASSPERTGPRDEDWEEHGPVRIVRDAYPDYDRFRRERSEMALLDELRRFRETAKVAPADRPTTDAVQATVLGRYLGKLRVSDQPAAVFQNVQVWPIVRDGVVAREDVPITGQEALDLNVLRVKAGGQDGTLVVENRDRRGREVLLLAGEVLAGGRRDHVLAEDVILPPGPERSVRALTTGAARRSTRRSFIRSDGLAPQRVRALLARGGDQAALDAVVADALPWLGSAGGSGSLDAVFANDSLLSRVDRYQTVFAARLAGSDVVGFAFAAGGDLLGIEVFDDHETFAAARPRVLQSYVLEALGRPRLVGSPPGRAAAVGALAAATRAANVDTGGEVSAFLDPAESLSGHGLLVDGEVRHAVVYAGGDVTPTGVTARRGAALGGATRPDGLESGDTGPGSAPMRGDQPGTGGLGER